MNAIDPYEKSLLLALFGLFVILGVITFRDDEDE